jgi:hypothetical protein
MPDRSAHYREVEAAEPAILPATTPLFLFHVHRVRVLVPPVEHDAEHRCNHETTRMPGTTIAADISKQFLQPCPRCRIQRTIGTVMVTAIRASDSSGYSRRGSRGVTPDTARIGPTIADPPTTIPTHIAATISRKWRANLGQVERWGVSETRP